jgi:hypothetical protein
VTALREARPRIVTLPRRLGPLTLGLVALLSTSGCSWIFVQPLPPDHGYDYQPCTSSRVAPVVDTIFTLTNLASALYVASENNVTNKGTAVTLGLGVGLLWALSAGYGYSHTAECEEAHELDERGYRPLPHLRAPPRYYPQPPPRVVDPAAAPAAAPPQGGAPQQGDDDDPSDHRAPPPSPAPAPKKPPERLDAPRFGG